MPTSENVTVAESGNKASQFQLVPLTKKTKKVKDGVAMEGVINYNYNYLMQILMHFTKPSTKTKYPTMYNLIPKTKTLMMTLADIDHGLAVTSIDSTSTLLIKEDTFPKTKEQFKKFFTYDWEPNRTKICLGCTIHGNQTLNHLKHAIKPSKLIQWLHQEKVFLKADMLGIRKTKTIHYLTQIHPCIVNRTSTKEKLYDILNATIINPKEVAKLDNSLQEQVNAMQELGDDYTVHCSVFKIFQMMIGIGSNLHIKTNVIGIKCQAGKAALLCKFLIQTSDKIKQQGQGKIIPARLANVIGMETVTTIIHNNNQYFKSITTIPINGIPAFALQTKIIIDDDMPETEQVPIKVSDYLLRTKWCHSLEPTEREGWYLLITTHQHIAEWLDENLDQIICGLPSKLWKVYTYQRIHFSQNRG